MQKNLSIITELNELDESPTLAIVIRQVQLKWLRIGPRLPDKLLSLPQDYAESLGEQRVLLFNDRRNDELVHVCGVVQYQFQQRPTFVIPFCGLVNFRIDE